MRLFWEWLKLGVGSLRANKLRTGLTLLGHVMGVITVVTLVSLIQGLNQYVSEKILVQGANLFYVDKIGLAFSQTDFLDHLKRPDIKMRHYERLMEAQTTLASAGAMLQTQGRVKHGKRKLDRIGVVGITPDSPLFLPYPLVSGRALREDDFSHRRPVCLLGHEVAKELFPGQDPVGESIRVGSRHYLVIGVLGPRGKILGQNTDNFVAVPLSELMGWFRDFSFFTILAQPRSGVPSVEAEEEVRWIMRGARGLRPKEKDDFEVYSSDALMGLYKTLTGGIFTVLLGVGGISLVVGGIVIMNIMLVSVTERTREIGVRKSLGARRRDILQQFLLESLVITITGGALGVLIGFGLGWLVSAVTPFPARITIEATVLALGVSAVVGLFFGIYPATRASRLDPVIALRYE